jgi:hypothetical protein
MPKRNSKANPSMQSPGEERDQNLGPIFQGSEDASYCLIPMKMAVWPMKKWGDFGAVIASGG